MSKQIEALKMALDHMEYWNDENRDFNMPIQACKEALAEAQKTERKKQKKEEKIQKIVEEIDEFLGDHMMKNRHYVFDEDIIKIFSHYKKKDVKRALKEVR